MKRLVLSLLVAGAVAGNVRAAAAAPIVGSHLLADGGEVVAYFLGHTAGYTNDLYLFSASDLSTPLAVTSVVGELGTGVIFTNHTSVVGSSVSLGSFAAGTELVFGIYVRNTGDTFYLGAGSRNPDGLAHGAIENGHLPQFSSYGTLPPGAISVGFEDLFGGGDLDFDDLGFAFTSVHSATAPAPASLDDGPEAAGSGPLTQLVSVPEPASLSLLTLGLAVVGARRSRYGRG